MYVQFAQLCISVANIRCAIFIMLYKFVRSLLLINSGFLIFRISPLSKDFFILKNLRTDFVIVLSFSRGFYNVYSQTAVFHFRDK